MSLVPRFVLGELDLTDHPFAIEFGSDLGNPETVSDVLTSLLADGEIESVTRRANRTMTIPLLIEGSDLAALADAEAALIAECDKPFNALLIDPGDGHAPVTAFDTFAATAERVYEDSVEVAGYRRWRLTIRALPYSRSVAKIVDDAGTPPATEGTLLNNCESTTGWSRYNTFSGMGGPVGSSITVDSSVFTEGAGSIKSMAGYSYIYFDSTGWATYLHYDKASGLSLDTDTGGYLSIAIRCQREDPVLGGAGLADLWMTTAAGEQEITNFVAARRDAEGFVHYVWPVAADLIVTDLRFVVRQTSYTAVDSPIYVWYDDVELLPSATTDHQIVKQLEVLGSARTTGSLRIAAPSDVVALGQVLAITAPTSELPAGFQPDGRRWVSQGATSLDADALDGSYFTPHATTYSDAAGYPIFDVPASMLKAGPYAIVALVKPDSTALKFGVRAQLRLGTTMVGPTSEKDLATTSTATWQFVTVGDVYLPPLPMQGIGDDAKVRLLFKGAKMANVYFIPAWEEGGRPVADFSIIDCGTGTVSAAGASSNLWIESPAVENRGLGAWWRGPTADRQNARSAWPDAKKPGRHTFRPGPLTAFLVSTGAAGPIMALEYHPAWHGNAAI